MIFHFQDKDRVGRWFSKSIFAEHFSNKVLQGTSINATGKRGAAGGLSAPSGPTRPPPSLSGTAAAETSGRRRIEATVFATQKAGCPEESKMPSPQSHQTIFFN